MERDKAREERLSQWIARYGDAVLRTCYVYLSDAALAEAGYLREGMARDGPL